MKFVSGLPDALAAEHRAIVGELNKTQLVSDFQMAIGKGGGANTFSR